MIKIQIVTKKLWKNKFKIMRMIRKNLIFQAKIYKILTWIKQKIWIIY